MEGQSGNIRVRFWTKYGEFRVPDIPYSIPSQLSRFGLSEVINHLLGSEKAKPFDFSINDHLIRSPLINFVSVNRISIENVVVIEYFPAVSFSDSSLSTESPSWIACLTISPLTPFIMGGCFDGNLRFYHKADIDPLGSIQAHECPIADVCLWSGSSKTSEVFATASRDQTIKCWVSSLDPVFKYSQIGLLLGHKNSVQKVVVSSDQSKLYSGDWDGMLLIWNIESIVENAESKHINSEQDSALVKRKRGKTQDAHSSTQPPITNPTYQIKAHNQSISGIQIHQNESNQIFTSSWDHSIKQWDMEYQNCVATLAGGKVITSMDYNPTARLVATSHPDGRIR